MRIAFRVDASLQIGTGHVMRCLTLANALRERGAECVFVCRSHRGHLLELIAQHGHQGLALPAVECGGRPRFPGTAHDHWLGTDWVTDAQDTQRTLRTSLGAGALDWMVVDHYALGANWEEVMYPFARRLMVIDDLADREHTCDLLLDQNLGRTADDYRDLLKGNAITMLGPYFALLRPEFAAFREKSLRRRETKIQLQRLLITMGGVDKDNATGQVLESLKSCILPADLHISVVMGLHAPWLKQVRNQAEQMPRRTDVLVGVNNIAQLMVDSDLAIGAAGSTSWERCCMGLPTIQLALALNQEFIARALSDAGAALMLDYQAIAKSLPEIINTTANPGRLHAISMASREITQGQGATIIADYMRNI